MLGRRGEPAPVAEVLRVDGDRARLVVPGERADELGRLDVRLVAQRDEAREPEADPGRLRADLEREVAALGDEADRAARQVLRDELELGAGVEDAEAVGSQQARAAGPRDRGDGGVTRPAGIAVAFAAGDR